MCRKCKREDKVDCVFQVNNPNDKDTYKVCRFSLYNYKCSIDENKKSCYKDGKCEISKSFKKNKVIPFYLIDNSKYRSCKFSIVIYLGGSYYCCHFRPSKEKIKLLKLYKLIEKNNSFVEVKDDKEIEIVKAKFAML